MAETFLHRFRVRYAEIDAQAIVFNSRYLEYADVIVSEFFRHRREEGMPDIDFHIRKAEIDYLKPIRLEDMVEGRLQVERIGNSSMRMRIALHEAHSGELRAEIALVQVHVDLASGGPKAIPESVRSAFATWLAEPVKDAGHA